MDGHTLMVVLLVFFGLSFLPDYSSTTTSTTESTECVNGNFGMGCTLKCNCNNNSEICNKLNGSCASGCKLGYEGDDCQQASCAYGNDTGCLQECHCLDNKPCNKTTGSCPNNECAAGWKGDDCHEECDDWTFGLACSVSCNCRNKTEICNKTDGTCRSGPPEDLDKKYQTTGIIIASGIGVLYVGMFVALAVCCARK